MSAGLPAGWLQPAFASPRVRALMSARDGGVSAAPFDTLNLRDGLGDAAEAVARNRVRLQQALGMPSVMLRQVHGVQVVDLAPGMPDGAEADASVCRVPGLACEIQVADCLPVLLADVQGRGVAAAHAGWRGLAGGVIEATLLRLCTALGTPVAEVEVWLGPCIGPHYRSRRSHLVGDVVPARFGTFQRPGMGEGNRRLDKSHRTGAATPPTLERPCCDLHLGRQMGSGDHGLQ